jgi:hypothetical protein
VAEPRSGKKSPPISEVFRAGYSEKNNTEMKRRGQYLNVYGNSKNKGPEQK